MKKVIMFALVWALPLVVSGCLTTKSKCGCGGDAGACKGKQAKTTEVKKAECKCAKKSDCKCKADERRTDCSCAKQAGCKCMK